MMSPEQSGRERIFICERAVNLRKSFDGLSGVVEGIMGEDPEAGDLFVFFNRTHRQIKVLQWQCDGFAIWMKRLEQGSFHLPEPKGDRAKIEVNAREFAAILNGIKPDILAHSLNCLQRIRHRVVHVKDLVQTQKKVADGRQICSLSALPLGKCDLFPFLPLLIIKRLSAPRFMNTAIMDNGNIVPLALFKVEFKSAIIPIGVIHHEEGAELVFLGQSEEIVLNNRTNCIDYPMLYS